MSDWQENATVKINTADQEIAVANFDCNPAANENLVIEKILERCFIEKIDRELGEIVDTVEDRSQNAILTAISSIITPKIEIASKSINACSERDETSVMSNSEREEHIRVNAPFENIS